VPLVSSVVLVAAQGIAVLATGAWLLARTSAGQAHDVGSALFLAVLALAAGVALVWLARPLLRGKRWARSPVVVAQLLALPVGAGLVQGALYRYAVPDLALAAVVLAMLATPAARTPFEPTPVRAKSYRTTARDWSGPRAASSGCG
jgi:hypothetical protein